MPGSADSDCVHGDADASLDECLAHLEGVLASEQTEDQGLLIIESLFTAALEGPVSSDHAQHLLTVLGREGHVALPALLRDSALPMAYILLTSNNLEAQEKGLHLLLDNPNNKPLETETLESSEKKPWPHLKAKTIKAKLITRLYAMLVEDRPSLTRRLVAKLLLDTITQASGCDTLQLSPEKCAIYYPRTASIFCEDKDIVLRFFAGAIIRTLYLAGEDEDLFWDSCNPEYRVKFLKCLNEFPENWALAFHRYETEHHGPRNSQTTPGGNERSGSLSRIINSVTIGSLVFEHDSILLSTTLESLLFILPNEEPISGFQFIDVPKQYILQPKPTKCDTANKYKHVVNFSLDKTKPFTVSGKNEQLGSTICLASDTDFRGLPFSGISPGPKPAARKPSSTFITLDTADEIERKSSECRQSLRQLGEINNPSQSVDTHVQEKLQVPPTPRDNPADEHEMVLKSADREISCMSEPDHEPGIPEEDSLEKTAAGPSLEKAAADTNSLVISKETTTEKQSQRRSKKSILPDTQESLVFHRPRRSNRNVYKGKSGPSVDWEEDLRPTPSQEEWTTESEFHNAADITSISSPFPGDLRICAKSPDTTKRKKRRAPLSANKEQPRKKTTTRGDERLPLATTKVNDHKTDKKQLPCQTAEGYQGAITTRSGKRLSRESHTVLNETAESHIQNTEDQRRPSDLNSSVEERPDRSNDVALEPHLAQNNANETGNELSEIHGAPPKTSEQDQGDSERFERERVHLLSKKKGSPEFAKRIRFEVLQTSPASHQPGTKCVLSNENEQNTPKRMKTNKKSQLPVSEAETDVGSERCTSEQGQFASNRRRYVVDETGSPRLDQGSASKKDAKFNHAVYLFEDSSSLSRRDSDSDDSNLADQSSSSTRSLDSRHEHMTDTMITPFSIPRSTRRAKKNQTEDRNKVNNGEKWESSLKTVQEAMHDMLRDTSKRFANQLEDERATITGVLETYRQGCNQVLDQLLQAHEERIELYKQQIVSVRRQHRDLCQDLVRQIEANDRRIAERIAVFSDTGSP